MRLAVGGDHAGFPLKGTVIQTARDLGHDPIDFGCYDEQPIDFPDITQRVCEAVLAREAERAILVCGTGVGASIAANKIPGIRASICHDVHTAHQCIEHDDVNVICIGAKIVGSWLVVDLLTAYLDAGFDTSDEDCVRRVRKLHELEQKYSGTSASLKQ